MRKLYLLLGALILAAVGAASTFDYADNAVAVTAVAATVTVGSGAVLSMVPPVIQAPDTTVNVLLGAAGWPYANDCQATLRDNAGATVEAKTSTSGFAKRALSFSGLTAATTYSFIFTCEGAQPDVSPYPFATRA